MKLTIVLVAALLPTLAFGHAETEERIAEVTRKIAASPRDARLFMKRGELQRLMADWPAALADFERAARLAPELDEVAYARGRALFEAGFVADAVPDLDRFLGARPDHADALLLRSRVLGFLGRRLEAVDDLTRAIAVLQPPAPEHYLERARLLAADGRIDEAVDGLDEGVARLGPLVTLIQPAWELEVAAGRVDRALARLDTLPRALRLSPAWLQRRAELLAQSGRGDDAHAAAVLAAGARWYRARLRAGAWGGAR
jgi:tetratricopeptide (TPR) repeat protein